MATSKLSGAPDAGYTEIDPADIADALWDMHVRRNVFDHELRSGER